MHESIEVIYENGLLRPLVPLPSTIQEHQRLAITIEAIGPEGNWLADADPTITLDAVRQAWPGCQGHLQRRCMPNVRNADRSPDSRLEVAAMTTPHELFREVFGSTGDRIAALRAIRERFGLDLRQAKEVMLQAEGMATSLDEHQERLADALERAFEDRMDTGTKKKLQRCPNCGHSPLREEMITDRFEYRGDDEEPRMIEIPNVPVEVCPNCGEKYFGPAAVRVQHAAVCRDLGLLTPEEIQAIRERFGPTQAEFARLTGIGEATISRWERGHMLPNRAMDHYLRLLRDRPGNAAYLKRRRTG
jgi:HTH-type transcriptional regulator/antitoxin MqsA